MPETSREFMVILPDDSQFTVPVQPSLQTSDLLDMAASHCKVKEKSYFGLMIEEDGYRNWLEMDKPVLDPSQEIPKGSDPVKIYFTFKYYIDTYQDLQDHVTVELLYRHCRNSIEKGEIITDEETVFELSALVMQATHGPYTTEEEGFKHLQALPVIPAYVFQRQSIRACEEQVIDYYKMLEKFSRGQAIIRYLEVVQSLPMYSYHYFEVKDKANMPLWLGVGPAGIIQCPYDNRNDCSVHYQWINLQNIYYKDKKFSVEVYTTGRSPRKSSYQASTVTMSSWYGKNSKVVMSIWKMVRDQHIFYRNRRTAKSQDFSDFEDQKPGMTIAEILRHLNRKHHLGSISPSSSHSSLSIESAKSSQTSASVEAVAAAKKAQKEMYGALLSKRELLVEDLESKLSAYKDLLLKEMQITGVPPEGLTAEEIEKMRTKFGINYKFSKFVLDKSDSIQGDAVDELEKQLEVQSAIIEAQKSLVDQAKNRQMKKDRKKEVKRAEEKYFQIEEKLVEVRKTQRRTSNESRFDSPGFSLPPPNNTSSTSSKRSLRHSSPSSGTTVDDSLLAKMIFDDSTHQLSPLVTNQKSTMHKSTSALHDITEIPHPVSPTHRPLSGTQSLAYQPYPGSNSYIMDSNRSYYSDLNDSFIGEYDHSPRSSVASLDSSHYEDSGLKVNLTDEFLQHYSQRKSSPNALQYGRRSYDHGPYQNHVPVSPLSKQRHSPPENFYSPSGLRNSYRSSASTLSPEPYLPGMYGHSNLPSRSRPQSTHSITTTPPMTDPHQNRSNSQPPHNIPFRETEMNLEEALMMDQDEGTLV